MAKVVKAKFMTGAAIMAEISTNASDAKRIAELRAELADRIETGNYSPKQNRKGKEQ